MEIKIMIQLSESNSQKIEHFKVLYLTRNVWISYHIYILPVVIICKNFNWFEQILVQLPKVLEGFYVKIWTINSSTFWVNY